MPHAAMQITLWLLGLCVGSFLNVVVYRLPRGLSVAAPRWSFCPRCGKMLAWYDNLPLLSWLLLGGRCRQCHLPISVRYPLGEALTGLVFVLVYELIVVLGTRAGIERATLPRDVPLLVAWLLLAAGLIACAAMDIDSYLVDLRVTYFVLAGGLLLHALWPQATYLTTATRGGGAAGAAAGLLVAGLGVGWRTWRARGTLTEEPPPHEADDHAPPPPEDRATRVFGGLGTLVFVALAAWLVAFQAAPEWTPGRANWAVGAALLAIFGTIVVAGGHRREADDEIRAALHEEQPQARRVAALELVELLPALVAGVAVAWLVARMPAAAAGWTRLVHWSPGAGLVPMAGLTYAAGGAVAGAAAGWLLRIGFTLIYGREAFGVGDIHILAAAGAAAGWDVTLLGLLLAVGIALAGWLLGLLLKSTGLIPLGPWLALGFVAALWWSRPGGELAARYRDVIMLGWQERPDLLAMGGGVLLVASAGAIILARAVRRIVAPDDD